MKKLVKKAKKGNKRAFEELILYYQKDLYKIAKVRLSKEEDINDAVQETIITAYESLDSLQEISKFKSWLITILINKCNFIYRKKVSYNTVSYEDINAERYFSENFEIINDMEFYGLINKLDLEERTILILHYVEGYKLKEIAQILNIKDSTIRSKLLRAKNKIKSDLEEEHEYE